MKVYWESKTRGKFYARDFAPRRESTWNSFPNKLCSKLEPLELSSGSIPRPVQRIDTPSKSEWINWVNDALESPLKKTVLARRSTFTFEKPLTPAHFIDHLQGGLKFCIQTSENEAFLGATPEWLLIRDGSELYTEAVAGTSTPGIDLLSSEKDSLEHQMVAEQILDDLRSLGLQPELDSRTIRKAGRVQHIAQGIRAKVPDGMSDEMIIDALHPTPAMGGVPRNDAIAWIAKTEPFDRGWYAAPLGWISDERTEIAVGIRSGLIQCNKLHIFAGLGIVEGSDPELEWEELENKISGWFVWD